MRNILRDRVFAAPPDCVTTLDHPVFVVEFSIIPRISTTRGVATKRYAQNVLFKSSDPNRRPQI